MTDIFQLYLDSRTQNGTEEINLEVTTCSAINWMIKHGEVQDTDIDGEFMTIFIGNVPAHMDSEIKEWMYQLEKRIQTTVHLQLNYCQFLSVYSLHTHINQKPRYKVHFSDYSQCEGFLS